MKMQVPRQKCHSLPTRGRGKVKKLPAWWSPVAILAPGVKWVAMRGKMRTGAVRATVVSTARKAGRRRFAGKDFAPGGYEKGLSLRQPHAIAVRHSCSRCHEDGIIPIDECAIAESAST